MVGSSCAYIVLSHDIYTLVVNPCLGVEGCGLHVKQYALCSSSSGPVALYRTVLVFFLEEFALGSVCRESLPWLLLNFVVLFSPSSRRNDCNSIRL